MNRICQDCKIEKNLIQNFTRRLDSCKNITYRWICKYCTAKKAKNNKHKKSCEFNNCFNIVNAKNMCSTHYKKEYHPNADWYKKYWQSEKGKLLSRNNINRRRDKYKFCSLYSKELKNFYKNVPYNMVVDHIIPITNNNVSGLHVPWNLQYLTRVENSKKRNKFDFTYENNLWRQVMDVNNKKVA